MSSTQKPDGLTGMQVYEAIVRATSGSSAYVERDADPSFCTLDGHFDLDAVAKEIMAVVHEGGQT